MRPYLILFGLLLSCGRNSEEKSFDLAQEGGQTLSKKHCGSCHLYPDPKLLDKDTWRYGTLPQMGFRMGIYGDTPRQSLIESGAGGRLVEKQNIYPLNPTISKVQWELINKYYFKNAPDSLIVPPKSLMMKFPGLKVKTPEFRISPPMITALKYNAKLNQLFVADAKADYSTINVLDQDLKSISTLAVPSPVSHIDFRSDTILATLMGGFIPTDNPGGSIIKIFKTGGGNEYKGFTYVLKNLQRPVHTTYADVNGDNAEDMIVCEYGNHTGKLSLYINKGNGTFEQKILSSDPGATMVELRDLNNDGLQDMIALMGQGNERIDIYYNQGDGNFSLKNVVRFPPSYGSVAISVVDWNEDGFEDIIYVNGDNADYSMILKPYHGVRIFLNDGHDNFSEAYFQHINGAYKALPSDFDGDGDVDIATVSFFPDLRRTPEEGFIYMENVGLKDSIRFDLHSLDQAAKGRWITAEAADINKDGNKELILGAFTGMAIQGDTDGELGTNLIKNSPTLMVLKFHQGD